MDYNKLKEVIVKKRFSFIAVFFLYLALTLFVNKTYITAQDIFISFPIWFGSIFVFTNFLLLPVLVSLTLNLAFEKIKDLKMISKKGSVFSIIGTFFSLLGGACPGCFVGLFPAFIGLFGASFTLSNLPFYGLEIQVFSVVILIISLHYLTRPTICLIK